MVDVRGGGGLVVGCCLNCACEEREDTKALSSLSDVLRRRVYSRRVHRVEWAAGSVRDSKNLGYSRSSCMMPRSWLARIALARNVSS